MTDLVPRPSAELSTERPDPPMTREELHALVEETLYSLARIRGTVPWEVNNLMEGIEAHVQFRLAEAKRLGANASTEATP